MKQLPLLLTLCAALAACSKESYRHAIALAYPTPGQYGLVYADQTEDSIVFDTFDSYDTYTSADWLAIDEQWGTMTIQNSYYYQWEVSVPLTFEPNTTGETREAVVYVHNYGTDWDQTISASFIQASWLNITRPEPAYPSYTYYPSYATFAIADSATWEVDSISFTAYGDWTLQTTADFVALGAASGKAGAQVVALALEPNNDEADRQAEITLTSNGVSNIITLTQYGATE